MTEHRDHHWKFGWMRRNDPIVSDGHPSARAKNEDQDDESWRAFSKKVEARSFEQLYSVVLGLPGRVRQYMRRYRKLQANGLPDARIAEEVAEIARKILEDRLEVSFMVPARISHDKKLGVESGTMDQLDRLSSAAAECDALLTLASYYFLPGAYTHLAILAIKLSAHPILKTQVSGVADVLDYAVVTKSQRSARQAAVRARMAAEGWAPLESE